MNIRTRNSPITSVPYVWCYLRQRTLRPVGDQAIITHRVMDTAKGNPDDFIEPPAWVNNRDTLRFLLALGSSRIPGESQFICLTTDTQAIVDVTDTVGSSLPPGGCLRRSGVPRGGSCASPCRAGRSWTSPSGMPPRGHPPERVMYDEAGLLPVEVPHDEWAGIYATVRISFLDEPPTKKQR